MADLATIKLAKKALILISVPLAFELFFAAVMLNMVQNSEQETIRAEHARMVYVYADAMIRRLYQIGAATYAESTIGGDLFRDQCDRSTAKIKDDLRLLKATVSSDAAQKSNVRKIETTINKILKLWELGRTKDSDMREEFPLHYHEFSFKAELEPLLRDLIDYIEDLTEREKQIKKTKPSAEKIAKQQVRTALIAGIVLNVILATWLAFYFNTSTTNRFKVLLENTDRLAKGEELKPTLDGEDEIAILDGNFHKMARELREAEEAKMQAERLKQEFFQMISHDLRTPLTSGQFFISVLLKGTYGNISERGTNAATGALQALNRVISMVNSILEIEKLSSQSFCLEKTKCSIEDTLIKTSDSINGFAEKNNIEIEIDVNQDDEFIADQGRLIQVLVNLAANAVKFSSSGQRVKLQGQKLVDEIEFSVIDTGRGIPLEHQKRIFERFSQVEKDDASRKGGTGLGLAICKIIVEAHNGEIGVNSEVGSGSRFWFRIPRNV